MMGKLLNLKQLPPARCLRVVLSYCRTHNSHFWRIHMIQNFIERKFKNEDSAKAFLFIWINTVKLFICIPRTFSEFKLSTKVWKRHCLFEASYASVHLAVFPVHFCWVLGPANTWPHQSPSVSRLTFVSRGSFGNCVEYANFFDHQDSLAEWSKALASGASPQGRGFEPHSCHYYIAVGPLPSAGYIRSILRLTIGM